MDRPPTDGSSPAMSRPSGATRRKDADIGPGSARRRFSDLLAKHLSQGTRPASGPGEVWTYASFSAEVQSSRSNDYVSPRTVSNWCKGASLPERVEPLLKALFGNSELHAEARDAMRAAFVAARATKYQSLLQSFPPLAAGDRWVSTGEQLVLDRAPRSSDVLAATDPLRQQLQNAVHGLSSDLADIAARLSNSDTWSRLPATATAVRELTRGDPMQMPAQLGHAYALMLQLGQFLEADLRIHQYPSPSTQALDPDIHGVLATLVRTGAPWLRGYPTVAGWDDEAGKMLVRIDLFQTARQFMRVASEHGVISRDDSAEVAMSSDAVVPDGDHDHQGQKARTRATATSQNLVVATAEAIAGFLCGSGTKDCPPLVLRAAATFTDAEREVTAFAASLPPDMKHALRALVNEGRTLQLPERQPDAGLPFDQLPEDVEAQAQALILSGREPPLNWHSRLLSLNFDGSNLASLDLLANLRNLRDLSLTGTSVSDLSPLLSLTRLQRLYLDGTRVTDLSPLSGTIELQVLDLEGTDVTDLLPLGTLSELQSLDLAETPVEDITPLSGLLDLRRLVLRQTRVPDVAPLSSLLRLQHLDLVGTVVQDVACLAHLRRLKIYRTLVPDGPD